MEKKLGKAFSWVCKVYNSFCNPWGAPDLYIEKLEADIITRQKREEDYPAKNHEEIMRLIEEYPLEVLQTLTTAEVDALAKKFADLLRASLLMYPMTREYDLETRLVKERIARPNYPLDLRFQRSFMKYFRDMNYRDSYIYLDGSANIRLAQIYRNVDY